MHSLRVPGIRYDTIRYDTIEEINVDSKAEYTA